MALDILPPRYTLGGPIYASLSLKYFLVHFVVTSRHALTQQEHCPYISRRIPSTQNHPLSLQVSSKTWDQPCMIQNLNVSRESVRIALTYNALNGVDVIAVDIRNAYLQDPSSQKDFIICGPEFGLEHVGKRALIRRALYGGKTEGRDF